LTTRFVATTKRVGLHGDGGNLWLQVTDLAGTGDIARSWKFRYTRLGKAHAVGLGPVHTIDLAEARAKARELRQVLLEGRDPLEEKRAARDAALREELENIDFRSGVDRYLAVHEAGWRNPKHRQQWRNTLDSYAMPSLGDRPVRVIDDMMVNATLAPIWEEIPETARRVRQRISTVCEWVKGGMPLPAPSKAKTQKHHAALPWQELPAFMAELRQRDSISARALEWTILTAARTGETIGAKWEEIDLDDEVWVVPAARMKAHREHRVPLSHRGVAILKALPRVKGDHHVFVGAKAKKGLSNMAMAELLKDMRPGVTVHGFRSCFRDWAAESTSYPREVAEQALAHTVGNAVERAYKRGDLLVKRAQLMTDWAKFLAHPAEGAKVVPMKARVG
jgi:integrase